MSSSEENHALVDRPMFSGILVRPTFVYRDSGRPVALAWIAYGPAERGLRAILRTDGLGRLCRPEDTSLPQFLLDDETYRFWYCFGSPPDLAEIPEDECFEHLGRERLEVDRNARVEALGRPGKFVCRFRLPKPEMGREVLVLEADGTEWSCRRRHSDGRVKDGAVEFEFTSVPAVESYSLRLDTPFEGGSIYYLFRRKRLQILR